MSEFPNELISQYHEASDKLKRFQRVMFKRFAPNVSQVSDEFNQLAIKFNDSYLPQYAGLCWYGAAKCQRILENSPAEIDFLLKSARAFVRADQKMEDLMINSSDREHLEGAYRSYNQALAKMDDSSPMKAAVIREMLKYFPDMNITSGFISAPHRYYDLEIAANRLIDMEQYNTALDKLTEISDDVAERKVEHLYEDLLKRCEISRLFLMLILQLPPSRQSPSNMKLFEKYSTCNMSSFSKFEIDDDNMDVDEKHARVNFDLELQRLTLNCTRDRVRETVNEIANNLTLSSYINDNQRMLLGKIVEKYHR